MVKGEQLMADMKYCPLKACAEVRHCDYMYCAWWNKKKRECAVKVFLDNAVKKENDEMD